MNTHTFPVTLATLMLLIAGTATSANAQYPAAARGMAAARSATTRPPQSRSVVMPPYRPGTILGIPTGSYRPPNPANRMPTKSATTRTAAAAAHAKAWPVRNPSSANGAWNRTIGRISSADGRTYTHLIRQDVNLQKNKIYHLKDGTALRYTGNAGYTSAPNTPTYRIAQFEPVKPTQPSSTTRTTAKKNTTTQSARQSTPSHVSTKIIQDPVEEIRSATDGF